MPAQEATDSFVVAEVIPNQEIFAGSAEEYLPDLILGHAFDDDAAAAHNEAVLRKRIDPILAAARKWRAENPEWDR